MNSELSQNVDHRTGESSAVYAEEIRKNTVVFYRDERYLLYIENGVPCLTAAGERLALSCHPYEPCLYIRGENGSFAIVRQAFDPAAALERFRSGEKITSATGREYDARDFCRMVEYAARQGEITITEAEAVFKNTSQKEMPADDCEVQKESVHDDVSDIAPEDAVRLPDVEDDGCVIVEDDPFCALAAAYPDCAVEWRIVRDDRPYSGAESHRRALMAGCRAMFAASSDADEPWEYSFDKAKGKRVDAEEFFAAVSSDGELSYRRAFLSPPWGSCYTDEDLDRINAALFPNGIEGVELYRWTTDWSDYFDDGREWWGTLCATAYDSSLGRFAVIVASATD